MNIQGMGNPHAFAMQRGQGRTATEAGNSSKLQEQPALQVEKPTAEKLQNNQGVGNGVIQRLQEGHFQGVASVRLQINFQYQLQELNTQKATAALESGSNELIAGLGEKVSELGASFPEIGGDIDFGEEAGRLMLSFESEVEGLFSFTDGAASDPTGILAGIDDAFQDFFNSLSQLALPALSEPVADDAVAEAVVTDDALPESSAVAGGVSESAVADDAALADDGGVLEPAIAAAVAPEIAGAEGTVAEGAEVDDTVLGTAVTDEAALETAVADDTVPETVIADDGVEPAASSDTGEAGEEEAVVTGVDDGAAVQEPLPVTDSDMEGTQAVATFADGLEELQTWFDSQMESLRTTINDLLSMPALGEPRGNGVAYSRFLAIYTELDGYGGNSAETEKVVNGGGLDTAA